MANVKGKLAAVAEEGKQALKEQASRFNKWRKTEANKKMNAAGIVVAGAAAAGAATGAGLTYDLMGIKVPLAAAGGALMATKDDDMQAAGLGMVAGATYDVVQQVTAKLFSATSAAVAAAVK